MSQKLFVYVPIPFFAFLLLSTLFITSPIQVNRSMALHTSGTDIVDVFGNVVYLRGIGRSGDLQSASGMWSGPHQAIFDWEQKWNPISANTADMEATFRCYRDYWHANMIRLLIPADWWWIDTVYPQSYQPTAANNDPISYRTYIETVVTTAGKYGLYVDFCPYSAVNAYSYSMQSEGEPGTWLPGSESAEFIYNVTTAAGKTEEQFWSDWWTSAVNRLGKYANVIFEMWNEPNANKENYFAYMVDSYQTIRGLRSQNLVFMQWQPGIVPGVNTLEWAPQLYSQLKASLGRSPTNLVFTTHPYLHAPYPNLQWAVTYEGVQSQLLDETMLPQTRSAQCTVPLVFNEMGVLDADYTYNWPAQYKQFNVDSLTLAELREREYSFWDAIMHNAKDLGVGVCVYYWMQDSAAANYGYSGEALVGDSYWSGSSPTPNYAGQIFIDYSTPTRDSYSWLGARPKS